MFQDHVTGSTIRFWVKLVAIVIMLSLLCHTVLKAYQLYKEQKGTTAIIVGTISDKQFIPAHTTTSGGIFFFSSKYHPDQYTFSIRRYDKDKKSWETATINVDKDTYNKYEKNAPYNDPSGKTALFYVENADNS